MGEKLTFLDLSCADDYCKSFACVLWIFVGSSGPPVKGSCYSCSQMKTLAGRLSSDCHQLVMRSSESRLRKAVLCSLRNKDALVPWTVGQDDVSYYNGYRY